MRRTPALDWMPSKAVKVSSPTALTTLAQTDRSRSTSKPKTQPPSSAPAANISAPRTAPATPPVLRLAVLIATNSTITTAG